MVHKVELYAGTVSSRGTVLSIAFEPRIRFEDGAEFGRLPIVDPDFSTADSDVSVDTETHVSIAFDQVLKEKDVPVLDCLAILNAHVNAIVADFAAEFL